MKEMRSANTRSASFLLGASGSPEEVNRHADRAENEPESSRTEEDTMGFRVRGTI
jgi:hypothetical protein